MELPTLETGRLLLRAPALADAARAARYHAENRAHLAPWEPSRPDAYFTPAFWSAELEHVASEVAAGRQVPFLLLPREAPDGPVLGWIAITNIVRGPFQAGHLGFSLAESAVGRGLMSEALAEAIRFAFGPLRLHRLMANHRPENLRSAALLARLGFAVEGFAPRYLLVDGAWRDHVLTSLVNDAWRAE